MGLTSVSISLESNEFYLKEKRSQADRKINEFLSYVHGSRATLRLPINDSILNDRKNPPQTTETQNNLGLARLLKYRLNDPEAAKEHFDRYREMRKRQPVAQSAELNSMPGPPLPEGIEDLTLPPLGGDVLVVSGLPRSGTSMLMQMLAAGGVEILTDQLREADEDNPKGYFEYEAAKKLMRDQSWVGEAKGKALKVVAPLVCSLPAGCKYRIVLIERDCEEILESQAKMIARRGEAIEDTPERRERLRREYARLMARTTDLLRSRPDVHLMVVRHEEILRDPRAAAARINAFAGGTFDEAAMAGAVDLSLHRNRGDALSAWNKIQNQ